MHNIATLIPVWKRPEVTQVVVEHITWLNWQLEPLQIQLMPYVVMSPEDPEPFDWSACKAEGWTVLACLNQPLGKKWNYGVASAYVKHKEFHSFMVLNSDSLVSARYIQKAVQCLHDGASLVGIGQCIFHNMTTGEAGQVSPGVDFGYGPGRLYSLELMRLLQWRLVDNDQKRNMERTIDKRLKAIQAGPAGLVNVILPLSYDNQQGSGHVTLVDLKSVTNLNSYDAARMARKKKGHWSELHDGIISRLYPHLNNYF